MDHFELLGLTNKATPAQVKEAWREKASVWHPDRVTGNADEFHKYRLAYHKAIKEVTEPQHCNVCKGTGTYVKTTGWSSVLMPCRICDGVGKV